MSLHPQAPRPSSLEYIIESNGSNIKSWREMRGKEKKNSTARDKSMEPKGEKL